LKKLLLISLAVLCSITGCAETLPGDDILAFVRTKLPDDPLKLSGTLKVRTKNGFTQANLPVQMDLNWGAATPTAKYNIGKESLTITWKNDQPAYIFSNDRNTPTSEILGTGITWADLSFSVLWWPGSKLIDEEKKINRECYVVDVPVPKSGNTMRLWIEKKMGMLLEAQTFDEKKQQIRRMKIKSIKKMDGMWVAKDLEILDKQSGSKTILQITDLKWEKKEPATAFDPAGSINRFTVDLYNKLSAREGNLFLSPYSISSALAMVYGGARGETSEQMNSKLHFGGPGATHPAFSHLRKKLNTIQKKDHVQLSVANSLWPQADYTFLPDYLSLTQTFYGSEIVPVDYKTDTEGARKKINGWIEDQTNDRIKDLIPQGMLNPLTRLVLANAIYFKGNWARQFKKEATTDRPFTIMPGTEVQVPTMMQTDDFKLAHTETLQALELPYEGGDLSMVVLLPSEKDGLTALEKKFSAGLIDRLQFSKCEVMVQLPRFKIESEFRLSETLAAMGMPLAFSRAADFSGMDGSRELYIGAVAHKAFVEVNEEGTEAAAATAVAMKCYGMPPQFIANHPFLFVIREDSTGTILFMGRMMDPSK
jgi:serpin B